MNYFDQNSTLEEEISNFLFFRPQNRLKLSNYWPNVITEVSRRYLYLTLFLMGLSPGPDYRRYLHWISKTAIFVISAPLLEHSWCFLWDYRRYLYLTLFLMGLSPGPDYRRYLHWISKTAIFVISAPLLEHSWCFLWDYRRYLYLTLFLMGLSPGPDYRRYLHWISKTAIFVISAPLLEHSWCFLWDYRRYLYLWPPDFRDLYRTVHTVHVSI